MLQLARGAAVRKAVGAVVGEGDRCLLAVRQCDRWSLRGLVGECKVHWKTAVVPRVVHCKRWLTYAVDKNRGWARLALVL
jgi:hypothetical protein